MLKPLFALIIIVLIIFLVYYSSCEPRRREGYDGQYIPMVMMGTMDLSANILSPGPMMDPSTPNVATLSPSPTGSTMYTTYSNDSIMNTDSPTPTMYTTYSSGSGVSSSTPSMTTPAGTTAPSVTTPAGMTAPSVTTPAPTTTTTTTNTTTSTPTPTTGTGSGGSKDSLSIIQNFIVARADFVDAINQLIVYLSTKGTGYQTLIQNLHTVQTQINGL